jgi:hypothetical protein
MTFWMQKSIQQRGSLRELADLPVRGTAIHITERICKLIGENAVSGVKPDVPPLSHKQLMGKFNGWEMMTRFNKNIPKHERTGRINKIEECKSWADKAFKAAR